MDANRIRALIAELQALLGDAPARAIGPEDVYLPVTGKVYPRPRPDLGEMFIAYVQRVGAATGRSTSSVGSLFLGAGHLFTPGQYNPDGSNWPEAADRFFNARAYMNEADRQAVDRAAAGWAGLDEAYARRAAAANHPAPAAPLVLPSEETPL